MAFDGEVNRDNCTGILKLVILSILVVIILLKKVLLNRSCCQGAHQSLFLPVSTPMVSWKTKQVLVQKQLSIGFLGAQTLVLS